VEALLKALRWVRVRTYSLATRASQTVVDKLTRGPLAHDIPLKNPYWPHAGVGFSVWTSSFTKNKGRSYVQ
jgi:hypothetical protein